MPIPVLLDTDIGTDVDDAYALLLAATAPELDLLAVSVVSGDVALRARLARRLLDLLGRREVPVLLGEAAPLGRAKASGWMGHEGRGIDLTGISPVAADGGSPAAMRELLERCGRPWVLLTIGPLTNAAVLLAELGPVAKDYIHSVWAMASSFRGFGEAAAEREHNVACDPSALQRLLDSGIPVALVGLNVTRQTSMTGADVEAATRSGGPLADALRGMHRVWFEVIGRDSSSMHDPLAVAAIIRPALVEFAPAHGVVDLFSADGTVVYQPPSDQYPANCRIAVGLDAPGFQALFTERIELAMERAARLARQGGEG